MNRSTEGTTQGEGGGQGMARGQRQHRPADKNPNTHLGTVHAPYTRGIPSALRVP